MAEINFEVEKQEIFLGNGFKIDNQYANVRSDTGKVLGIVTDTYKIVQNYDAINFVDGLVEEGLEFEKGGCFHDGRAIWIEGKLPKSYNILGDDVDAHVVFTNAHDGKGSVRVAILPNRLFCSNQLNYSLKHASRSWSIKHCRTVDDRLEEARCTLGLADTYMQELTTEMEQLAMKKLSREQFSEIINKIYPVEGLEGRALTTTMEVHNGLWDCLDAPDIENFKGTAYGAALAVTDYFDHREPLRMTKNYFDSRLEKIIGGHPDVDKMFSEILIA